MLPHLGAGAHVGMEVNLVLILEFLEGILRCHFP